LGVLSKQASIEAPVGAVFRYVADPHNAPHYISAINRIVSGPKGEVTLGESWQAEANFLGQPRSLRLRLAELVPDRRVRFELQGEPQAVLSLGLSPGANQGQTDVSLTLDVPSVPTILLQGLMGAMLAGDMQRLKRIMER
jgi:hypothetical protein